MTAILADQTIHINFIHNVTNDMVLRVHVEIRPQVGSQVCKHRKRGNLQPHDSAVWNGIDNLTPLLFTR